ncbi:MAG: hypothetical protein H9535_21500 [Ignavibacteria bacterium]|nr:hypothetical protein [Ignavibacteria bacterium]
MDEHKEQSALEQALEDFPDVDILQALENVWASKSSEEYDRNKLEVERQTRLVQQWLRNREIRPDQSAPEATHDKQ